MSIVRQWTTVVLVVFASIVRADEQTIDYSSQVKPLLLDKCGRCHGVKTQQASLRLDFGRGIVNGGDSGPAVIPGESAKSLLVHAITGTEGASQMPPEGDKLEPSQIELVKRWIDTGAKFPEDEPVEAAATKSVDHWSFKPIPKVIPPEVVSRSELKNGIDNFIRHRLEQNQLAASEEAERTTLIRRVYLDLLGVLPPVDAIHEFLADQSPDSYERLVDRLLASPHYGERWGRDWLDSARYADSNGFTRDQPRTIWKYRDWVIGAINANMPFDQFTIEQLAGDLLPNPSLDQYIATGFHRNTLINEEGGTDPEQFRVEAVVDRVNTTGTVFLGLTVGCCQCHDHKYDPLSQREYYQLYSFFNSTEFIPGDQAAPRIDVPSDEQIRAGEPERKAEIRRQIAQLEQELKDQAEKIAAELEAWVGTLSEDDKKKLPFNVKNAVELPLVDRSEVHKRDLDAYYRGLSIAREKYPQLAAIGKLREAEPKFSTTMITREAPEPRTTFIQMRGDFLRPGAKVESAVPAVLLTEGRSGPKSNRLDLARWLVSSDQPLTSRVIANRYWQRFFGRGIVETENDFGTQGDAPTHPELLDWLAGEFRGTGFESGAFAWDVKRLHRLIVTSATYRQSSRTTSDAAEKDPMNKLLARQSRLRVDAEIVRDSALVASGLLTEELGGSPVYPPQPDGVFDFTQDKKPWKTSTGRERYRKALYTHLWRSSLYPAMAVFDFPEPNVTCTRRVRSNTPLQSLTLANDETFYEFARGFSAKLLEFGGLDDSQRLTFAFETAVGREPNSSELARLRGYLFQQRERFANDPDAANTVAPNPLPSGSSTVEAASWTAVSRVLMNLDEFITRE